MVKIAILCLAIVAVPGCRRDQEPHREATSKVMAIGETCHLLGKTTHMEPEPSEQKVRDESPWARYVKNVAQAKARSSANGRAITYLISASSRDRETARQLASAYDQESGNLVRSRLEAKALRVIDRWGGLERINALIHEPDEQMFFVYMHNLGLRLLSEGRHLEGILALGYAQAGGNKDAAQELVSFADNNFEFVLSRFVRSLDPSVPLPKLLEALDITVKVLQAFEPPDLRVR